MCFVQPSTAMLMTWTFGLRRRFVLFVLMYYSYIYFHVTFQRFVISNFILMSCVWHFICTEKKADVFGNSAERNFMFFRISNNGGDRIQYNWSVSDEIQNKLGGARFILYVASFLKPNTTMVWQCVILY